MLHNLENSYFTCKSRLNYILILSLNFRSSEPGYSYKLPYCDKFLRGFIFASPIFGAFCVDLILRIGDIQVKCVGKIGVKWVKLG